MRVSAALRPVNRDNPFPGSQVCLPVDWPAEVEEALRGLEALGFPVRYGTVGGRKMVIARPGRDDLPSEPLVRWLDVLKEGCLRAGVQDIFLVIAPYGRLSPIEERLGQVPPTPEQELP